MTRRLIVAAAAAALLLLGTLVTGFVVSTKLNNDAVIANRMHGNVTRGLVCEVVRKLDLPARGC